MSPVCFPVFLLLLVAAVESIEVSLTLETTEGTSFKVSVDEGSSIKDLKKKLYMYERVSGVARLLHGQDVLADDSTLEQHNITEGTTLALDTEPERQVNIEVKCGPKPYQLQVSHAMTVRQLKMQLIENEQTTFLHNDFDLVVHANASGTVQEQVLDSETFPLNYYGIENNSVVNAVAPYMYVKVVDPNKGYPGVTYEKLPKLASAFDLKQKIMHARCEKTVTDISMFIPCGETCYSKIDMYSNVLVHQLLRDQNTVYYIEDTSLLESWPVVFEGKMFARVYGSVNGRSEKVFGAKLRVQNEFGVPVNSTTARRLRRNYGVYNVQVPAATEEDFSNRVTLGQLLQDDANMNGAIVIV